MLQGNAAAVESKCYRSEELQLVSSGVEPRSSVSQLECSGG